MYATDPMDRGSRALAYIRVSVVGDRAARERFESPNIQRDKIDHWASPRGIEIVGEIEDLNRSGGTLTRPGLKRALERLAAGEADGIIVANSDRASRSVVQGLGMIDELEAAGKWIAATDGTIDNTTPEARMTTTIILAASEREIGRFRAQSKIVHRQAIVDKGRHMGPAPFGYVRDDDGRLTPDPDRAEWVRYVFRRRADGEGWVQISRELDGLAVRQANGRLLNPHMLRRMARHRVYLGEATHGEHVHPNAHQALVDEALWAAMNRAAPTVRSAPTQEGQEVLLRGLLRCSGCRYTMKRLKARPGGERWRCRSITPERSGTHDCEAPAALTKRQAQETERVVVERFFALAAGETTVRIERDIDVPALERQVAEAEALLDELSSLELRRELGADRWGRMVRDARVSVQAAERELQIGRTQQPAVSDSKTLERLWDGMTALERGEALRGIVKAVMVDADGTVADRIHVVAAWEDVDLPRQGSLFTPRRWPG